MKFNILHRKKAPKIHWKVKSEKKMGDYVALHWRLPKLSKEFGIKKGQVWVRLTVLWRPARPCRVSGVFAKK